MRSEMSRRKAYEIAEDIKVQIAMKQEQKKLEAEEDAWFAEMMKQKAENQKPSAANERENSRFVIIIGIASLDLSLNNFGSKFWKNSKSRNKTKN